MILEFIFTLALALKCYPLQPGGLLAIEAIFIGMAPPEAVYLEAQSNFEVILLLMFMVAGIYFMKDLLLYVFTKILLGGKIEKSPIVIIHLCSRSTQRFSRRTYRDGCTDQCWYRILCCLS